MAKPTVINVAGMSGFGAQPAVQVPLAEGSVVTIINLSNTNAVILCYDEGFNPDATWPLGPGNVLPLPDINNLWIQNANPTAVQLLVLKGIVPVSIYFPTGYPSGGGGGGGGSNSMPMGYALMGAIVLPTGLANTIPPLTVLANVVLTGIYAYTLSGTVTADIQHNGITIVGLGGVVITSTPTLFTPTAPEAFIKYDEISVVPTAIATPLGLVVEFVN